MSSFCLYNKDGTKNQQWRGIPGFHDLNIPIMDHYQSPHTYAELYPLNGTENPNQTTLTFSFPNMTVWLHTKNMDLAAIVATKIPHGDCGTDCLAWAQCVFI